MKRSVRTVLVAAVPAAVLSLVLSACGLIPDQTVSNPLGINGKEVTLNRAPGPGIAAQAISTSFSGAFDVTFNDVDTSGFPSAVTPNALTVPVGVQTIVEVASSTTAAEQFPTTLTVTHAALGANVSDGSGSPTVHVTDSADGQLLILTQTGCTGTTTITCSYNVTGGSSMDADLFVLRVASDISDLWTIVTTGDPSNTLTGTFALDVSSDTAVPNDATMNVTFTSAEGTLAF